MTDIKTSTFLQEGDIINIKEGHTVYAEVPKHFIYSNCKGDFSLSKSNICITGELKYLAGKYIVIKTAMDGGGQGHGPGDIYPDGYHVYCECADPGKRGTFIDFYQSGSFNAMIEKILPIGKARLVWEEKN